jgi:hypothetical protein
MTAMRAARHERRAIIRTRMQCPANVYPLGLALSDVESYYRAGTIESGLIRLNRTVSSDERAPTVCLALITATAHSPAVTPRRKLNPLPRIRNMSPRRTKRQTHRRAVPKAA